MKVGQQRNEITAADRTFIEAQPIFFVATAAADGRVNVSPKGLDSLRVVGRNRIVWLNLTGSGNETAAHVREHPRMTLMLCAFDGAPRILRLYGRARVVHARDPEWPQLLAMFPPTAGARQIFDVDIDLVYQSCGWGVPKMKTTGTRQNETFDAFFERLGPEGIREYQRKKNTFSLDGKPTGIE